MTEAPPTGPEAIQYALSQIDLEALEAKQREIIKEGKKTHRRKAVKILNVIEGLKRNQHTPGDLMITSVPVIPPQFRPFSVAGSTYIPGDANEMYRDLIEFKRLYGDTEKALGKGGANEAYMDMYNAAKATYGYGDSPNPKLQQRSVKGFFQQVTGTSPKTSFYQRKMLSKTQDSVGRGVIIPDAEYDMNTIGIPQDMGWKMYAPYVQRRLVQSGMSAGAALRAVKDRTVTAQKAIEKELDARPVMYSRSPSWHKFNVIGGKAKLVEGDAVRINTFVTDGLTADFDGDTITVHVPSSKEAVQDVKNKLMPDKMLWSIKDKEKVMPSVKHEQILGLFNASNNKSNKLHTFDNEDEALRAIDSGEISLSDHVEIGPTNNKQASTSKEYYHGSPKLEGQTWTDDVRTKIARYAATIEEARKVVNTSPSDKQKKAENYKKGHIRIHGLDITLENPKGSTRSGVDPSGEPWSITMQSDYGYFKNTLGADGDHVDCFLGENHDAENVYVVDQVYDGEFDEVKCMFGFDSQAQAESAYMANYAVGWKGLGSITPCTLSQFKWWLRNGDTESRFKGQLLKTN